MGLNSMKKICSLGKFEFKKLAFYVKVETN